MKTNMFIPSNRNSLSPKKHLVVTPGIWIDGKIYWIHDSNEKLISEEFVSIYIKKEAIHSKIELSEVFIKNHSPFSRKVKLLFVHHIPNVNAIGEHFSFISPVEKVIFHMFKGQIYLVNGYCDGKMLDGATIQPYWNINTKQIWSSLEKGVLKYQPMSKGMVASIFSMSLALPAHNSGKGYSWMIVDSDKDKTLSLNDALIKNVLAIRNNK